MKRIVLPIIGAASLCLLSNTTALAQTVDGSMLFVPNVDLSSGGQNGYVGFVGGVFLTSYDYYPKVNYLGYYDMGGDGLANSHTVSLWDLSAGNTLLATVTVPAGTSAPLVNGFRWVELPSTVDMTYNNWYVIDAQTDNVDLWGDLITNDGGAGQVAWSGQYANLTDGYQFSRAGRYDSAEPPSGQSGSDAIYPVANLGFNVVPEPATVSLLAIGASVIFGFAVRRKN